MGWCARASGGNARGARDVGTTLRSALAEVPALDRRAGERVFPQREMAFAPLGREADGARLRSRERFE